MNFYDYWNTFVANKQLDTTIDNNMKTIHHSATDCIVSRQQSAALYRWANQASFWHWTPFLLSSYTQHGGEQLIAAPISQY